MKIYKIPVKQFYSIKKMLDQTVFWRMSGNEYVEIRPVFKYAKRIIESILSEHV